MHYNLLFALTTGPCTHGKYDNIYMFSEKQYWPYHKILTQAFPEIHVYIFNYISILLSFSFIAFFCPFIFWESPIAKFFLFT